MVDAAASEPAFNQLRTKEQLGYSVSVNSIPLQSQLGLAVEVTSSSHSVAHVLRSIDAFLTSFRPTLVATWRAHTASLLNSFATPDVALSDVNMRVWVRTFHSHIIAQ